MIESGVYPDIPMEEYHASDAVSSSSLREAGRSIDHYQAYLNREFTETKATRIGTAIHSAVLEPEDFQARYIDSEPPVDVGDMYYRHVETAKLLADGKKMDAVAEAVGVKPKTVKGYAELKEVQELRVHYLHYPPEDAPQLADDEMETVLRCRDAVMNHPVAREIIEAGTPELSHFWTDEETGIDCRCRPDSVVHDDLIVDLKSCQDARPDAFARSVAKWRYHVQAGFYQEGVHQAAGQWRPHFIFIAVETNEAAGVRVYDTCPDALARGRDEARTCLQKIHQHRSGETKWTGYPTEITTLELPAWA